MQMKEGFCSRLYVNSYISVSDTHSPLQKKKNFFINFFHLGTATYFECNLKGQA